MQRSNPRLFQMWSKILLLNIYNLFRSCLKFYYLDELFSKNRQKLKTGFYCILYFVSFMCIAIVWLEILFFKFFKFSCVWNAMSQCFFPAWRFHRKILKYTINCKPFRNSWFSAISQNMFAVTIPQKVSFKFNYFLFVGMILDFMFLVIPIF